jgi:AcrR family transcriptional regulator
MSKPDTSDLAARRGYHHGNLREALIEAARRLTAERGPHGFTVADAARLAGVSPSAPYRHFRDRDALMAELARRGFALFAARLGAAARGGGLGAMGPAYLGFAREEPGYYGAMFSWRAPSRAQAAAGDGEGGFGTLVAALAPLLPGGGDQDAARLLALQVWAISHGVAEFERVGVPPPGSGAPPPEAVLGDAVDRLVKGSGR